MATIRYYTEKYIQAIADAIRTKNGKTRTYTTREMGPAIMEMVTYLTHLKVMSSWWVNYLGIGSYDDPTFTLEDIQSGYAVFDANGHLTCPAKTSEDPGLWLRIKTVDGGWEIYPVIHSTNEAIAFPNNYITTYPMTNLNTVPYSTLENDIFLTSGYGSWRFVEPEFSDTVFSHGSVYIWNIAESETHPALIDRLDSTHSGVISFINFSRDFTFPDLIDIPSELSGEVTGVVAYHNSGWNDTLTSFHFHTNGEKLYYDTSEGKLKCTGTFETYNSPASYPNVPTECVVCQNNKNIILHKTKLSVTGSPVTSAFEVSCTAEDIRNIIPFRTYDIKDQNGNSLVSKNCDIEDFGIEPKEE